MSRKDLSGQLVLGYRLICRPSGLAVTLEEDDRRATLRDDSLSSAAPPWPAKVCGQAVGAHDGSLKEGACTVAIYKEEHGSSRHDPCLACDGLMPSTLPPSAGPVPVPGDRPTHEAPNKRRVGTEAC